MYLFAPDRNVLTTRITEHKPSDELQIIESPVISMITPIGWQYSSALVDELLWKGLLLTNNGDSIFFEYGYSYSSTTNQLVLTERESIYENASPNRIESCFSGSESFIKKNSSIIESRIENGDSYFKYVAKLAACDSTYNIEYNLDPRFHDHLFDSLLIDGKAFFYISPKTTGKGITGARMHSCSIWGNNLDGNTQNEFRQTLESIKFKW